MHKISSRRSLLLASAGLLAAPAIPRAAPAALRVGNQKGGLRSLLEASGGASGPDFPIEWSEFPAAAPLLEALSADALDVGNMGDLAFLSVFASGAPLRAYAATRADPRSQAVLVRADSGFRSLADLRGRRVAGNRGGWGQFLVRAALKRMGLEPGDGRARLPRPCGGGARLPLGRGGCLGHLGAYVSIEVERFGARVLLDGTGLTPTISFLAAHENALRQRRPQLAALMARQRAGWAWAESHLPEYAATNARLTRLPEEAVRRAFEVQRTRAIPLDSAVIAELQDAADRAVEFGLLRQRLDVTRALDTGFSLQPGL